MAKSSDVILLHGAWADGSSWAKVIPLLAARGHSVTAVQLPLTSLGDDVATVKRAIALASGPIILAGHSYGGAHLRGRKRPEGRGARVHRGLRPGRG